MAQVPVKRPPAKEPAPKPKGVKARSSAAAKKTASNLKKTPRTTVRTITGTTRASDPTFAQSYAPQYRPPRSVVTYRHILAFEFFVGLTIIMTSPQDFGSNAQQDVNNTLGQAAAFIIVFVVLFGITSAGDNAAKISSALGALIVLSLLLFTNGNNIITRVSQLFGNASKNKAAAPAAPATPTLLYPNS